MTIDTYIGKTQHVNILLIDDDDVDAKSIERAIRKNKILNPIIRAKHGLEALAILQDTNSPDQSYLILLDLNMPQMNGIEFLKVLRDTPELRHLLVFVLTTSEAEQDIEASYQYNIAGYLVKKGVEKDFMDILKILKNYWRLIELPNDHAPK